MGSPRIGAKGSTIVKTRDKVDNANYGVTECKGRDLFSLFSIDLLLNAFCIYML